jgi:hypothetical protein
MNSNLLLDTTLTYYGLLIGCGIILGCSFSLYKLIKSNYTASHSTNIPGLTNEEIEAIIKENALTIFDSDSDSDYDSDHDTEALFDYDSTSDTESISDIDISDLFFMPNVDLKVCSIQELKFFEISSIYAEEIAANNVTDEELIQLIDYLKEDELFTNKVNSFIYHIITTM